MWCLLLLIGLAAAQRSPRDSFKDKRFEYIVTNQNLHIDKLEHDLDKLKEKFSHLSHEPDLHFIKALKARVTNLEGSPCPKGHQVPCGGDVPQCIDDLFICDGHKDCKNGMDEDDDVCSLDVVKVGSAYTGLVTWDSCEVHEPHNAVITITAADQHDYFKSRVWIRGVVSFEVDEDHHLVDNIPVKGYYNFGKRYLVMIPDKSAYRYGIRCVFNLGDHDNADCTVLVPGSLEVCAHLRVSRN